MSANEQADAAISVPPTFAEMRYGPHERHVFDYWAAKEHTAPLLMFVHGGGFRSGDKSGLDVNLLSAARRNGLAVASINYRLSNEVDAPAFMYDGARALQTLRARAQELGFDRHRVALCGGSAGAGISLWIGFHDDLAHPLSEDPVSRQSTRVRCIAIFNGQCSYDPRLFRELGLAAAVQHSFIEPFYGMSRSEFGTPQAERAFEAAAAITYLRRGAPPLYAHYRQPSDPVAAAPEPDDPDPEATMRKLANLAVHHPRLGEYLKQKMEAVGSECVLEVGMGRPASEADYANMLAFVRRWI